MHRLALIVPLGNEARRIIPLVESLAAQRSPAGRKACPDELLFIDRASTDGTAATLASLTEQVPWVRSLRLAENAGHGIAIQAGFSLVAPEITHVSWWPACRHYSIAALHHVWAMAREQPNAVHKGWRTARLGAGATRAGRSSAHLYDALVRRASGLPVRDVNGLPKIFPLAFVRTLRGPLSSGFLFDAQILLAAHTRGLPIFEHPVTYYPALENEASAPLRWRLAGYRKAAGELLRWRELLMPARDR